MAKGVKEKNGFHERGGKELKKHRFWFVALTEARPPPVPPDLPLCALLRNGWSSCRERQYKANLPRFWAKEKKRCLEQVSAREGFAKCEKCLQVKSRRQTAGRVPQIPAVRRFFASVGEKRLALICVL